MVISISQRWPGAILTFFYLVLFFAAGAKVAGNELAPFPQSLDDGAVTVKLGERAPQPQSPQPLSQPPPPHLRPRDPNLVGLLGALNAGKAGKKGNKNAAEATIIKMATVTRAVTKAVTNNVTVAAPTTVFVTMPASTLTSMIMMTVTAPAAVASSSNTASTSSQTSSPTAGFSSVLTLGFLSQTSSAAATPVPAQEAELVTPGPEVSSTSTAVGTVFGIATETSTLVVTTDDGGALETGTGAEADKAEKIASTSSSASASGTGSAGMRSEGISGRQAGTRCVGFGAVVVAIGVAVLIL